MIKEFHQNIYVKHVRVVKGLQYFYTEKYREQNAHTFNPINS